MSLKSLLIGAALGCVTVPAYAAPFFTTFGPLPEATFGGTGIPNNAVAISRFDINGDEATLGLTATPRFSAGPVTNDGAGTFFADPGSAVGGSSATNGALWNFSFYVDLGDNANFDDVDVILAYDFNPAAGNELLAASGLGVGALDPFVIDPSTTNLLEGSQNLLFSIFQMPSLGGGIDPIPGMFDPDVDGDYFISISIIQNSPTNAQPVTLGGVGINVIVGDPVDVSEPATLGLLGLSLVGIAAVRRRR